MHRIFHSSLLALCVLFVPLVHAADPVTASHAMARAVPKVAPASAVFVTLHNSASKPVALVGGDTPVARSVELHTHTMQDGMMAMRRVESVPIPAGESVVFQPGGLHIMLIGLQDDLVEGHQIPLTLSFDDGSVLDLEVPVGNPGAAAPAGDHAHHHMR